MAMSLGQPAAVSRHDAVRSHQLIGLHSQRPQSCRMPRALSIIGKRPTLQCKSFRDDRPSNDERERQSSSLEASCSGQQGPTPSYCDLELLRRFMKSLSSCPRHLSAISRHARCPPVGPGAADQPNRPQQRWQLASWLHSSRQSAELRLLGVLGASAGLLGLPCL